MSIRNILQMALPLGELKATVLRFPLSVLCSSVLFIIGIVVAHDFIDDHDEMIVKLSAVLGCCYFWCGISKLTSESLGWNHARNALASIAGALVITHIVYFTPMWHMHLIFLTPSLLLMIMVAPYLRGGDDMSFWFFNRMMWFGVAVSYIALFMFAGGLSVALGAIHVLFDVDIDDKIYVDIWLFACLVLGPIYALSWVPKKFAFTKEDCNDPPGLKFIVNWISVPMVFIYLLILYAYFIKIVLQGQVPSGHLAPMISGFVGAGVVTFLLSWPLREEGSPQLQLFHKIFFPALIIPAGFHIFAIWERVNAYGITEQRYYLMLTAIWFAFLALGFTVRRLPIKFIPMMLAVLLLAGSTGPWGGVSVSGQSQYMRLEKLLLQNKILVDGKIVKVTHEVPFADRKSISSSLDYLCHSGRKDLLLRWFAIGENKNDYCSAYTLTEQMGFTYLSYYEQSQQDNGYFNISGNRDKLYIVKGYDYLLGNQYVSAMEIKPDTVYKTNFKTEDNREISVILDQSNTLFFRIDNKVVLEKNLEDFVVKNKDRQDQSQDLFLDVENDVLAARIDFSYINGNIKDGKNVIGSVSFDLLFRIKK